MRFPVIFLLFSFAAACSAQTVTPLWERGYAVIPDPQRVELRPGDIRFGPDWSLDRGAGVSDNDVAVETLREELHSRFNLHPSSSRATVVRLEIQPGSVTPGAATDPDK